MEFVFASKNIELTDAIKTYVTKKLSRLEKIYDILQAEVMISVEKYRHIADAKLITKKDVIKASETSHDLYASIDLLYENLERQLKKLKEKKTERRKEIRASQVESEFEGVEIVRKKIDEKPITLDEAINLIQKNTEGVLAFYNSETENVNVLYKNSDGSYTLIET
ncbi:MAG: ribosome hibernation-promoting factor, HPF/YfiA family [Desulfurella sp.]|uniref:ribosome hibernation-promoting factor, HPF/YfiA family n=1 Tax=Desulfurella TaxID=33001 RepID=UPI000CAB60EF|nr:MULTISPECIES: ribosome-associated translation inhibitor RaiA [Desulfurella]PMP66605.1 MAG: ribosomal subunit interface protein [Desulfurella multipotens]PMP87148.1 MAG: ribosomal subunit interface protein [Desulfurella sp.]HEX14024.1 ribosome-associated translation inhibitor RaiA [Desulfurella acetivorans]